MKKFDIPEQMAHLKIDERGYPIPFFVPIVNGVPNFKFADKRKQELCIDKALCHVCGKKLNPFVHYFITGPKGLANKTVTDAGMHKVCAEFALMACPHMLFEKAERKETENPLGATMADMSKPSELYLIKSNKYKAKFYRELGHKLIHFNPTGSEKYIYVNNKLQKA